MKIDLEGCGLVPYPLTPLSLIPACIFFAWIGWFFWGFLSNILTNKKIATFKFLLREKSVDYKIESPRKGQVVKICLNCFNIFFLNCLIFFFFFFFFLIIDYFWGNFWKKDLKFDKHKEKLGSSVKMKNIGSTINVY